MTTTTAKLASAKLTDEKGVPDDHARRLYDQLGATVMGIGEFRVRDHTESADGGLVVTLELTRLELTQDGPKGDHLREFARAIWRTREPQQLSIDDNADAIEPTEDEVVRRGEALIAEAAKEAERRKNDHHVPVASPWEPSDEQVDEDALADA